MTTPRRPYGPPRTYTSFVKVTPTETGFLVVAEPHPIHAARIVRQSPYLYRITMLTVAGRTSTCATEAEALTRAGEWVGRLTGAAMQVFKPMQRLAMGQGRCPFLVGQRTCDQAPEVGTVWCRWHKGGVRDETM